MNYTVTNRQLIAFYTEQAGGVFSSVFLTPEQPHDRSTSPRPGVTKYYTLKEQTGGKGFCVAGQN